MLALSAARNGEPEKAVEWLLHPLFVFDDAGYPVGGIRVATPYFPGFFDSRAPSGPLILSQFFFTGSGSLLYAIAMMAAGWTESEGHAPGFPTVGWDVRVEGVRKAL